MTNILRCFKHLFAAYITKCISIISDYVRQRHISVVCLCACLCVCVWPRVQVTFCILKATPVWVLLWGFFFSLRWKMEMWSMICCYHHQLKSFHAACIFRCLLRAAWQTTPLAVCPVFFPLRFPSHGWSSSEWHYLSAVHCSHVPPLIITGAHM